MICLNYLQKTEDLYVTFEILQAEGNQKNKIIKQQREQNISIL